MASVCLVYELVHRFALRRHLGVAGHACKTRLQGISESGEG